MRIATEFDWPRASRARRSSKFDCSGSGSSWLGLWDFAGEYSTDGSAFRCLSQLLQSFKIVVDGYFEEDICIYSDLIII